MKLVILAVIVLGIIGSIGYMMTEYKTVDDCLMIIDETDMISCLNNLSANLNITEENISNQLNYSCDTILDPECMVGAGKVFG